MRGGKRASRNRERKKRRRGSPDLDHFFLDVQQLFNFVRVLDEGDLRRTRVDLLAGVEELAASSLLEEIGHLQFA